MKELLGCITGNGKPRASTAHTDTVAIGGGAIVIFGRAFGLRVGGRASPSRGGQIQCTQKASGDNRQPALIASLAARLKNDIL